MECPKGFLCDILRVLDPQIEAGHTDPHRVSPRAQDEFPEGLGVAGPGRLKQTVRNDDTVHRNHYTRRTRNSSLTLLGLR